MATTIETYLTKIAFEISQAEQRLEQFKQKMQAVEQAGMYPAVPAERWKDERYLYLYFADGALGLSLDSKRRLYIGADPAKIEEAHRLVNNRWQWNKLSGRARELAAQINRLRSDLKGLAGQAERWQREDDGRLLGLDIAGQPGAPSPNELGPENAGSSGAISPKRERDAFGAPYNDLGPSGIQDLVASIPKSDYEIGDMHFEEEYD